MSFRPGVMTALMGPFGCGKSTLLTTIMGFLEAENGSVTLKDRPLAEFNGLTPSVFAQIHRSTCTASLELRKGSAPPGVTVNSQTDRNVNGFYA